MGSIVLHPQGVGYSVDSLDDVVVVVAAVEYAVVVDFAADFTDLFNYY